MTTYTGTQDVEPGLFLNLKKMRVTSVERRGPLPGTADDTYRRVPMLLMLAVAPLFGLVYVVFLPLIGFVAVGYLLAGKLRQAAAGVAEEIGRVRRPAWAPMLAFLSRSKPAPPAEAGGKDVAAPDAWREVVEKELNETDRPER